MALAEDFDSMDAQTIASFIANAQEEHLQLDFKTISNANLGSTDDRRNLAKAVGGFANSSGGIIVWGVAASRDPTRDNMDCATEQALIDPVALFVTRLNTLTGEASSPIVDGVRHKAIVISGTAGFAVTLVPESSSTPHMSKLGENRYYKRSGDSFRMMEHFDLEDMFGRRAKPRLNLQIEEDDRPDPDLPGERFKLWLTNSGRAVARYAGVHLRLLDNAEILQCTNGLRNLVAYNQGRQVVGYNNDTSVIHPNGIRIFLGTLRLQRGETAQPVNCECMVYAEGVQAETDQLQIPPKPVTQPTALPQV